MIGSPRVSTIIPTYNRAGTICETVESVLAQTYSNVEVIVVDDGSTDDTLERLKQFGNRIHVEYQENRGPAAARNRGVAVSSGELIAFLDSDDIWLPSKLDRQVALMNAAGDSITCCLSNIQMKWRDREFASFDRAWLRPDADEGIWVNPDQVLATRFVLFNQGIVIRREVLVKLGGFDESLRFMEDYDLALRLSLEGPWSFIREPLVVWRETKGSLYTQSQREDLCIKTCTLFEKLSARLSGEARSRSLRRSVVSELGRARRLLLAVQLEQRNFLGAKLIGRSIELLERLRQGTYRRSPWFPKMQIEPAYGGRYCNQ